MRRWLNVLKTLKRTVKLESDFLNAWKYHVLKEVEEYQRLMLTSSPP